MQNKNYKAGQLVTIGKEVFRIAHKSFPFCSSSNCEFKNVSALEQPCRWCIDKLSEKLTLKRVKTSS